MKAKMLTFIAILILAIGAISYDLFDKPEVPASIENSNIVSMEQQLPTPDFTVQTLDGTSFSLQDIKEEVILLNFWASWCTPCIEELPDMLELVRKFDGRVALLAMSIDQKQESITKFLGLLEKAIGTSPIVPHVYWVWDQNMQVSQKQFNTTRVPETIIIDAQRNMVKKVVGVTDWKGEEIEKMLRDLLGNVDPI